MGTLLTATGEFAPYVRLDSVVLAFLVAVASWLILAERHRCRREVQEARERYRSILQNAPDAVILFDEQFQVAEWNAAAERLYGISREKAIGRTLTTVPLERWNELRELLGRIARNQQVQDYESERLRADGTQLPVALSYARMPAATGGPVQHLEIAHDIRERLQMRDKLLEVEKLTLMGRMAAGTAHHLNTPLTAMLLETELLAERLKGKGREEPDELAQIKARIRYCQAFVRELLSFGRASELQQKPASVCEVVGAVAAMLRPSLVEKNADLAIRVDELKEARVLGDSNHLEVALSALLSNAADAIPYGGSIQIQGDIETETSGEITMITIDDNGPGIPAEIQGSVFEPFFTTKPAGHGTGLGLPIARNIVERHGGTLQLKRREGGGTRAMVRLPILAAAGAPRRAKGTAL